MAKLFREKYTDYDSEEEEKEKEEEEKEEEKPIAVERTKNENTSTGPFAHGYRIKVRHANKGDLMDDVFVQWDKNELPPLPANVFRERYGYYVRKVLFRSFNHYHSTMENWPLEVPLYEPFDEIQLIDQENSKSFYQVFLTSTPYNKTSLKYILIPIYQIKK